MVKGSALHLALVIALVVTIMLGSLIYLHYFYRQQQQQVDRHEILQQELRAGITLALSNDFTATEGDSLFLSPLNLRDSLRVGKRPWGLFDAITVRSWRLADSLNRAFLAGVVPRDSTVLYVVDEDRPLSISGKSVIQGKAPLPKSGIRPAFVDGEYYSGIEQMVDGKIEESTSTLPGHEADRIDALKDLYKRSTAPNDWPPLPPDRALRRSFLEPPVYYTVKSPGSLLQDSVVGNIVIIADSSVTITAQTVWKDAILIAPHIKLEENFSGQGQFFALDSLTVGRQARLRYPSVVALLASDSTPPPLKLRIEEDSHIEGLVLHHRATIDDQKDILELGKNVHIHGDVISYGLLKYTDPVTVHGSVYTYRLITQRPSSLYENYLINLTLERSKLHPYFVRPHFWTSDGKRKLAIVQWLE